FIISIGIRKHHIPRLRIVLQKTILPAIDLLLILENSVDFISINISNGLTDFRTIHSIGTLRNNIRRASNNALSLGQSGDLILICRNVEIGAIVKITYNVIPGKSELISGIFYITTINIWCACAIYIRNRGADQPIYS